MDPVDLAWKEVRRATSHTSVVGRATTWLQELWPAARRLGLVRKSVNNWVIPFIYVDNFMPSCIVAQYDGDSFPILGPKALDQRIAEFVEWGSPTLSGPIPKRLDYLRATILHEVQHGLDDHQVIGIKIHKHNQAFYRRLTKLEKRFSPYGL